MDRRAVPSLLASGIALALLLGSPGAFAQAPPVVGDAADAAAPAADADAAATATARTPKQMDAVVVTAQKRTERLLDVPMSITAISAEQLVEAGAVSTGDLQQVVPGLTTVNNGLGFVPVIRGVSSQGTSPGDESNVSIYLDDVYIGAPLAGLFDLADIERVEVLKGPQGTLFGRNATGGAIRIVSRTPQFTPDANFSVDYGFNFNEWKLGAYATGPLGEKVAGSLSASYRNGEGHIDGIGPNRGRTYGGADNYLVRGKLLFQPSDALEMVFAADAGRSNNHLVATVAPPAGADPYPGNIPSQPFQYAGSSQPLAEIESNSASLDLRWDASDAFAVRSITAYRDIDLDYRSDNDRTDGGFITLSLTQYQKNFSQEFNFSGGNDALTWMAGVYYYDSEAGNPNFTVTLGDEPGDPAFTNATSQVDTSSYAGFGDVTWDATEKLHVTLGARYTSETKKYAYRQLQVAPGGTPISNADEETWTSPTYRGVLRYDFTPDSNVYLSLSNGFKSGVYDAYSAVGIPVAPEEVDAVEIGAKARVNGITWTAAAYDYDYTDIQVASFVTIDGAILQRLSNAAAAKMRGFEFTAEGNLSDNLSFSTGANWTPTAEFKDFTTAQITRPVPGAPGPILGEVVMPYDASGSRIPRTPKWTANARLTYSTELWGGYFSGTLSAFHSPGFYWQAGNLTPESSYNLVGTRLAWTNPSGRITYSIWGTNLTDSDHSVYTTPNIRGDSTAYAQGRQIGIGIAFDL